MFELKLKSRDHTEFVVLTQQIQERVIQEGWIDGLLTIYCPHTTAGITIQENADPDVVTDMIYALDRVVPWKDPRYRHSEGNTAAHVKAAMMGSSAQILVENSRLLLGIWQGVYFCEFDGPRNRTVWLSFFQKAG
jgi:secondary thiamine-phosphate synthase enzyme